MTPAQIATPGRGRLRHLSVVSAPIRPLRPTVAVVICVDARHGWDDLDRSLRSVVDQTSRPDELWLVVESDEVLMRRARRSFAARYPDLRMVVNTRTPGQAGARNTALERVGTEM